VGELIAVLSGKGGTGKTSLCAGIATALAERGEQVLCIDCDIGLQNLDLALGLSNAGALSFMDIIRGAYPLSSATRHPRYSNLAFLTAPVNCRAEDIDPAAFSQLLRSARTQFRYVFRDAPAGLDAGFRLCATAADRVILVTNGDAAAVRDAARTAQILDGMGKHDVRLVVNRTDKKMFKTMCKTVDDVMDEAALPLLGIVPNDSNVTLATVFDEPLLKYTKKGAAAACRRIARRIQGLPVPVSIR
jgi:septum site-determining protein MinD